MNWIVVLAIAVISDALRIFIDNYVADIYFKEKDSVAQKIISGLVLPIAGIVTLFFNGFDPTQILPLTIILLMLSGIFSSLAGIPYFKALEIDDSTNIGIFFQFSPILYLFYGWFFTGVPFNFTHLIGALIILSAPFIIVISARKRSRKVKIKAAFYAFISILFYVASGALFVQADSAGPNLFNEIGLTLIFKGISDVIIIGGRTHQCRCRHAPYPRIFLPHRSRHRPKCSHCLCSIRLHRTHSYLFPRTSPHSCLAQIRS